MTTITAYGASSVTESALVTSDDSTNVRVTD